ncbi:Down syndrome cell adhesion molecule-like protein Dscam2 isoform X2 [Drosophila navojoa]|uniref:Down syndrome cell adhesion molecule-like protein Dscam2 isoform X2 n=1 Tax=Drosophila navojoa TaxID=7232 RepID=UPI0011BE7D1E|nr:Down syndrome cell adhesion molecule-like protein Dscam2 isoform X2 [Drosophila navojoa]
MSQFSSSMSPSAFTSEIASNDNGRSSGESSGQVTIRQNDDFTSALSITSVTRDQSGTYTCRVQNDAATVTHSAQLKVNVPPRWTLKPTDQDAILGNSVIVSCKADGFPIPTIQWKQSIGDSGDYRDLSYAINNGNSQSNIMAHSNGSLMISKVAREHEGSYLCQATNGIGAGLSTLIKLTVHVGPTVTVAKNQLSIRRGERITLRCEATGDQPLQISWRSKANRIDPSYDIRYHIKNSPLARGVSSELTILQTVLTDRGEYTCIASNAYGRDRSVIHVQVQEPPNFPVNLHVRDLGSRSVTLAWSPNDQDSIILGGGGGNNRDAQPISNYILQYKKAGDVWHEHNNQKLLPGDRTTAQLGSLRPAQVYHIRLFAENHLGTSAPSDILFVQTDSEVPSAPPQDVTVEPLGPQQLLITWRAPVRDSWNGELLGYTISYQKQGSPENEKNHTKVGSLTTEGLNDFRLIGLEKYTQYGITVSAFNIKGDGPPSDVVLGHTLEDVPSASPRSVSCVALTAQNIQISWQAPPKKLCHGVIQGYKLLYEPGLLESEYSVRETKITSALSTVLHGLQPFTNYSVQVLAFTRAGEGIPSSPVSCITEEAVPDAPELVKAAVNTESSVIISWLPPRRPNGLITKYNVYIRVLEKGQELKILKEVLPAHNRHFEAKDLNFRETYEAWVTASTRVGQGPSTPVIKLVPSTTIPAAIISFSQTLFVNWRSDIKLACVFVGNPKSSAEWKILNIRSKKHFPLEVNSENTLTLRNIQRSHEGNYSCIVRNPMGSDHIVYQLFVQVPPSAPIVSVNSAHKNSVSIQWRVDDIGGAPIKGFTLTYRRESAEWDELQIDRRITSYMIENLQCGTKYQFTMTCFNKIGTSVASAIVSAQTKGNKPIAPQRNSFIRSNTTSVILDLSSWQDGGCPILYFSIEFKHYKTSSEWIIVSNKIETHNRYSIGDLEPGTAYQLRVTANNNAGSTTKEFYFETQNLLGLAGSSEFDAMPEEQTVFSDVHFIAVIITSIFGTILALIGAFICFRNYPHTLFTRNVDSLRPQSSATDGKDIQSHEHFYGTVRKSCQQTPNEAVAGLERIPEYSEDIYPYATFHLPEHENQSGNIPLSYTGSSLKYDSRCEDENTLCSSGSKGMRPVSTNISGINSNVKLPNMMTVDDSNNITTEKRSKRRSKIIKSESEEYDSLNSDSDLSGEREQVRDENRSSNRETSSFIEDEGTTAHGRKIRNDDGIGKERSSVFSRPQLHSNALDNVPINYRFFDPGTNQQRKSTHHCDSQRKVLTIKSAKAAIQCPDMSRSVPSCQRLKSADSGVNCGTLKRDCGEAKIISRQTVQSDSCNEKLKLRESDEFGYRQKFVDTNKELFAPSEGDHFDFSTHRRNIYSIESVSDSLGITNSSHDYNCMDTLSNTETLAIGSTMSDHKFQMENTESLSKPSLTKITKAEQLDYILTEKRVSPPSAFVDRVG